MNVKELFNQYYSRLCTFAYGILADEESARDIVQDLFVLLCDQPQRLRIKEHQVKSFLYTSVRNACLNKLRHQKVKDRFADQYVFEETDEANVLNNLIHAEITARLHQAIEELPTGCALILKKGYLEGLNNEEIAQELKISIHTVKSQKQRGLKLIREKIDPDLATIVLLLLKWL